MTLLEDIHFRDCRILRVIEETYSDKLYMEVEYPVDWERDVYESRTLVFRSLAGYEVHEMAFDGPPTILDWSASPSDRGSSIRLNTNAGYRITVCSDVTLQE